MSQRLLSFSGLKERSQSTQARIWFGLSLIFPIYFGVLYWHEAFSQPYLVQDDVRQHVVWFQQFADPAVFQNDVIADYFLAIAPPGYKALYYSAAKLGIEPLLFAKLLPPAIGILAAIYAFGVTLQLFTVPAGACLASLFLTQSLWLGSDLVSATSRAFPVLFFLAFLYYLLKRSLIPCLIALILQGLFYPVVVLVQAGILTLRLVRWQDNRLVWSRDRKDYRFWLVGVAIAFIVLLIARPDLGELGPTVTAAAMRTMPEFQTGGRAAYFTDNFWQHWLISNRGLSPPFYPPVVWLGLLLPIVLKWRLPLTQFITKDIKVFWEILIPSFMLFFLAHLLLMRLYFPSRYTQHSLRIVMTLAAGIVVTILLETGRQWLLRQRWSQLKLWQYGAIALVSTFTLASLIVPALPRIFSSGHVLIQGKSPALYEFFAQQPNDILIASLAEEVDNLPVFSQRSVLVSPELALPFHVGYYNQMRQRAIDLINAHYSPNLKTLRQLIRTYGVDFFVVQKGAFQPDYLENHQWLMQFQPAANAAIARLQRKQTPALAKQVKRCTALDAGKLIVLKADCIAGAQPHE